MEIIKSDFYIVWDDEDEEKIPDEYNVPEEYLYEKMILELCELFNKDSIYIENNYSIIDYYTYMSIRLIRDKYESDKMKGQQ